ncbi:MAG TPA: hypothetical protein VK808_01680 [Bacteroidia bacterium]|nr:hypothetical protein [Bacteroidia bacterium]
MKKLFFLPLLFLSIFTTKMIYAQKGIVKRTITLGTIKSADAYRAMSRKLNYGLERADRILNQVPFAQTETQVTICILTLRDLGFDTNVTYKQVCQRALQMGYHLCPAEVGPALRLQYTNQPNWVPLDIAMQPILAQDGNMYTFAVEHINSSSDTRSNWLDCDFWDSSMENWASWFPNDHFVFMCSK